MSPLGSCDDKRDDGQLDKLWVRPPYELVSTNRTERINLRLHEVCHARGFWINMEFILHPLENIMNLEVRSNLDTCVVLCVQAPVRKSHPQNPNLQNKLAGH